MAIISNFPSGGGKKPFLPQFTGKANLVFLGDGSSGYMEFYTSGTLTWLGDKRPSAIDAFCVGGGGGGSGRHNTTSYNYTGGGGGSGYTQTARGLAPLSAMSVVIGAGGIGTLPNSYVGGVNFNQGGTGGTTSIANLCVAEGGEGGYAGSGTLRGGKGGSGGGGAVISTAAYPGAGGSNGANGGGSQGSAGQGSSTKDIFNRIHAGGGGGGGTTSKPGGLGGASHFVDGKGQNCKGSQYYGSEAASSTAGEGMGGGGYGGGGGGANVQSYDTGGDGGQGFAMIAWGDYSAAIVA